MSGGLATIRPDLPAEVKRDPVVFLRGLTDTALAIPDQQQIVKRLALIQAVRAYGQRFGKQAEPVLRAALAARLAHERRLGKLLMETVQHQGGRPQTVVPDDSLLPPGVSRDLSSHAQALAAAPEEWFEGKLAEIGDGGRMAVKEVYLQARRQAAQASPALPLSLELLHGDFREVGSAVADESVALIFTDPPYDRASLPLYGGLAELAARVLLPGGSLVAYAPTYALPQIFEAVGDRLRYWWQLVVLHSGPRSLMMEYGVRVAYKPLLWFTRGGRHDKQRVISDVIVSQQEKTDHEWQQGQAEARALIEALTDPGDLVLDPMAGSGTTLLAAKDCGRRWLGIEQDKAAIASAVERLKGLG